MANSPSGRVALSSSGLVVVGQPFIMAEAVHRELKSLFRSSYVLEERASDIAARTMFDIAEMGVGKQDLERVRTMLWDFACATGGNGMEEFCKVITSYIRLPNLLSAVHEAIMEKLYGEDWNRNRLSYLPPDYEREYIVTADSDMAYDAVAFARFLAQQDVVEFLRTYALINPALTDQALLVIDQEPLSYYSIEDHDKKQAIIRQHVRTAISLLMQPHTIDSMRRNDFYDERMYHSRFVYDYFERLSNAALGFSWAERDPIEFVAVVDKVYERVRKRVDSESDLPSEQSQILGSALTS